MKYAMGIVTFYQDAGQMLLLSSYILQTFLIENLYCIKSGKNVSNS